MFRSSSSSKGGASAINQNMKALSQKHPRTWTVAEVSLWLESIGLGRYASSFKDNAIGGAELLAVGEAELMALKVLQASDRARFLQAIQRLKLDDQLKTGDDDSSSSSSDPSNSSKGSTVAANEVLLKLVPPGKDQEPQVLKVNRDISYSKLRSAIKRGFGKRYRLTYQDSDGDVISIRSDSSLAAALSTAKGGKPLRIAMKERSENVSGEESYVLEALSDAIILADGAGIVKFMNRSAERLFGFRREEVIGKNCNMLMPPDLAARHDAIIANYLRVMKSDIIGVGRDVTARKKDGTTVQVRLTITHDRHVGRHGRVVDNFTAAFQELQISAASLATTLNFSILDALPNPALVIDESCKVVFSNKQVAKLLGFAPEDIVGKNVKTLMTSADAAPHDGYVQNYLRTGQAKIIGQPYRKVVAQRKDGTLLPVSLSVNVQALGTSRYFTGMLTQVQDDDSGLDSKNLLQMQREMVDNLPVPALIADENGLIQAFNTGAQQLFGYSLIDVVGKNVKILTPPDIARKHDEFLRNYLKTGQSKILGTTRSVAACKKGGTLVQVKLSVSERRDSNTRLFVAIVQLDA